MVLATKLLVSLAFLGLLLFSRRLELGRGQDRRFTILSWCSLAIMRLLVFAVIYLILNIPAQSDLRGYYSEAASAVDGGLIYRDFESSYGPVFTYMDAAAVYLWRSPKSVVLLAIILELASFPLWLTIARRTLGETTARAGSLLYILSPIPFFATGVSGLNQSLGAAYLGLAVVSLMKRRDGLGGFVMGMAMLGVKFLMALFAPITLIFSRDKIRFLITFLTPLIAVYGLLLILGADLTVPFKIQVNDQTSGNLPFFFGLLGLNAASPVVQRFFDVFTLTSLVFVFLFHAIRTRTNQADWLIHMFSAVGLTFMLCSKKSYTTYLVLFYFPLCFSVARYSFSLISVMQFGIFNLLATLEPSLLFRWVLNLTETKVPSLAFVATVHRNPIYISVVFVVCELALVSFYFHYLFATWRVLVEDRTETQRSQSTEVQFA